MKKNIMYCLMAGCFFSPIIHAEGQPLLDANKTSIGAGISSNSIDAPNSDNETGFQFFIAYDLDRVNLIQGADSSVELGYMDYGFSGRDSDGLFLNYVIDGKIRDGLGWLARLGLDLGDDSGLMFGAGLGLPVTPASQLRLEYVVRDDIDSLQLNFIHHL